MARRAYIIGDPKIDAEIDRLAKKFSTPHTREYIRDIFTTAIKLHLDKADDRDLYLINTTLKELRHIFRIFKKYRKTRKVVIFGSHRTSPKSREYKMAEDFSKQIVKQGYMVITGGGGGVMEAGNKGAGKRGFAVKIKLPEEYEPNPYVPQGEQLINVKYFYTRKLAFLKESDATVLFPGGFGTHDEGFEVLTLLQTGKMAPRPIIFVETPGKTYWKTWFNFLKKELLRGGYLVKEDFKLFSVVKSARQAVEEIESFYRVYHSIRYHRGITIIRLNKKISEEKIKQLNKKYRNILDEPIKPCGPLPVEVRCKELLDKPRVCLKFHGRHFGKLLDIIRDLNRSR